MRSCIVAGLMVAVSLSAVAGEAEDLRDRALRAKAGSVDDLKKFRFHELKASGISNISDAPSKAAHELLVQWPSKARLVWHFQNGPAKTSLTLCASGDRGWKQLNGTPAVDLSVDEVNDLRSDTYAYCLSTLVPFLETELPIKMGPPSKVGGQTIANLIVSRRGWPEVTLGFDPSTYQLRRMVYTSRDGGIQLPKEMLYDGQKLVNGVQVPTSQVTLVQGKEIYKWTEMTYRVLDKLEATTFDKP